MKDATLRYQDHKESYVRFTDSSRYEWACVITQCYKHEIDEKEIEILHPITYMISFSK